jgi:hypothetical protein
MPAGERELLADVLRHDGQCLVGVAADLKRSAELKRSQPRTARGFQVVKDWGDGVMRDGRNRSGRPTRKVFD